MTFYPFQIIFPSILLIFFMKSTNHLEHPDISLQIDYALYPNTKVMVPNTNLPIWKSFQTLFEPYGIELIASEADTTVEGWSSD